MSEFVALLKKATGVDDWDIEHVKGDEQIERSKDLLAQSKMWPGMGKLALAATVTGGLRNDFATDEKLENEMPGLLRENLGEVVTRVLRDGS
jgi:hypothetical protein